MEFSRRPKKLGAYHQSIWDNAIPKVSKFFAERDIDIKDISMEVQPVRVEWVMATWPHKCQWCGDIVSKKTDKICNTCKAYWVHHHIFGSVYFAIHQQSIYKSRLIFYIKGSKPKVLQRNTFPHTMENAAGPLDKGSFKVNN